MNKQKEISRGDREHRSMIISGIKSPIPNWTPPRFRVKRTLCHSNLNLIILGRGLRFARPPVLILSILKLYFEASFSPEKALPLPLNSSCILYKITEKDPPPKENREKKNRGKKQLSARVIPAPVSPFLHFVPRERPCHPSVPPLLVNQAWDHV